MIRVRKEDVVRPEEIVAYLRGHSDLPTLLVEGKSDMSFLRLMEKHAFKNKIDIFPVGSRATLFEIYKQLSQVKQLPVAFLADADMLLFEGFPQEFSEIVFTDGYSIENDILGGGKALLLITKDEEKWERLLDMLSHWFASIVCQHLSSKSISYSDHPLKILDFKTETFSKSADAVLVPRERLCAKSKKVVQSPLVCLRGHTLHQALVQFLHLTGQKPTCDGDTILYFDVVSWDTNQKLVHLTNRIRDRIFPPNP